MFGQNRLCMFAVALFLVCSCVCGLVFAQADAVDPKILVAENAVKDAYVAVLGAEDSGANVSGLLSQLNLASGLLADAKNAYRGGDFVAAAGKADGVAAVAQIVVSGAQSAKQEALSAKQDELWSNLVFTVIGSAVFVCVLFFVWRRSKAGFVKRLGEAKPEVVVDEA